jgi:protein required for attachment to host cells
MLDMLMPIATDKTVTRVVVADQAEARFYDYVGNRKLRPAGTLSHPESRLHDRDLKSDRPGRLFDRAPPTRGRRGAGGRHAAGGRESPHEHEAGVFAHEISAALHREHAAGKFGRLVLVAGPPFLGTLRGALSKGLRGAIVAEVPKDLIHESENVVRARLPRILIH